MRKVKEFLAIISLIALVVIVVAFWALPIILALYLGNWLVLFLYLCWIPVSVFFTIFVIGVARVLIEIL